MVKFSAECAIFSPPSSVTSPRVRPVSRERALVPVSDSLWAISFSWCGKIRSAPPPWMSIWSPRVSRTMAEHSMCQPGRPRPHGLGQDWLAFALAPLPQGEIARVALAGLELLARGDELAVQVAVAELAVLGETT